MGALEGTRRIMPVLLVLALVAGCGSGVRVYRAPALESAVGFNVAVLPFSNMSVDGLASDVIGFAIIQEMLNRDGYRLTSPSLVNEVMAMHRIRYAERMTTEQVRTLGQSLGVDGLLIGAVDIYEYRNEAGEEIATVSLHMRIIETTGGEVLWAADHHRAGNDGEFVLGFGLVDSLADLAQKVVREMIATLPDVSNDDRQR